MFLDRWIVRYGVECHLLTDNVPKFVNRLFATLCGSLGLKYLTKTGYHTQTNGQTETETKTLVTCLEHYVAEQQQKWNILVQPLTYAYSKQAHRATSVFPCLALSGHPLEVTKFDFLSPSLLNLNSNVPLSILRESPFGETGPDEGENLTMH